MTDQPCFECGSTERIGTACKPCNPEITDPSFGMIQPHQIDREAVVERLRDEARKLRSQKERGPAFHAPWGQDIIDANNAKADLFTEAANLIDRPAPEAVAWREKVRQRVAEIVEAAIERHVPTNSLRHTLDDADAILALIATHPVQGGEA